MILRARELKEAAQSQTGDEIRDGENPQPVEFSFLQVEAAHKSWAALVVQVLRRQRQAYSRGPWPSLASLVNSRPVRVLVLL